MRKGFTLIELLAVIVILAIIALIAVPIVINIINDSKKESLQRSVELYIDTVQKRITQENMKIKYNPNKCNIQDNGNVKCYKAEELLKTSKGEDELIIEMNGKKPSSGEIIIGSNNKITFNDLLLDGYLYNMGTDGKISKIKHQNKVQDISNNDNNNNENNETSLKLEKNVKDYKWVARTYFSDVALDGTLAEGSGYCFNIKPRGKDTKKMFCTKTIDDCNKLSSDYSNMASSIFPITQECYYNSKINIHDTLGNVFESDPNTYELPLSNIPYNYFLLHAIDNGKIYSTFVCLKNNEGGLYCMQENNYDYNISVIKKLEEEYGEDVECVENDSSYECTTSLYERISVSKNNQIFITGENNTTETCYINVASIGIYSICVD